jgi:hypothetical protein
MIGMPGRAFLAVTLLVGACTTAPLDADPLNLDIEIGRYGALLGQVAEYTGVAAPAAVAESSQEGPAARMQRLRGAVAGYNAVRRALCASRVGATSYLTVRAGACGADWRPPWPEGAVTDLVVARRSRAAGERIIGLWSDVCAEARRLEQDPQAMVCPME